VLFEDKSNLNQKPQVMTFYQYVCNILY